MSRSSDRVLREESLGGRHYTEDASDRDKPPSCGRDAERHGPRSNADDVKPRNLIDSFPCTWMNFRRSASPTFAGQTI